MQVARTVTKIEANPLLASRKNEYKQLNVAAYCRVSTDSDDQLQSYEAQVSYYTDHICKNPKWHFVGIYADEGITGTMVNKRERFKDMIKDCEKGKIDLILTKSVSRFARNTVDSLSYVRKLKAMGIGVFFEEQNIDTLTTDSEMFIGLYSVMAQSESENISANIRWGIQQRMKNGSYAFNYKTYGYRKGEGGEPEIVPEEAEVVRKIFRMYLDGATVDTIAKYIKENGIKNRNGHTDWKRETIRLMLSNEKYVGDLLMQKTFRTDCISKKTKKNNGELPKYLVSNNHPAIIDRDVFKMVQQERARRAGKRKTSDKTITELGKYSSKYALSEILICGECGSPYRRRTINSHGEKKIYWRCLNRIEHGSKYCSKSVGIEECVLHEAICKGISRAVPQKEEILNAMKTTLEYAVTGENEVLDRYNIELNIKQLQEEADMMMVQASRTEGDTERYFTEIESLYAKVKALRQQLETLQTDVDMSGSTDIEVKRIAEILEKEDFSFTEFDDIVIRRIVECIRVMGNKSIVIILKGGFEITESLE
ncbi:MAG: recombinase family protein [Faecalibacterium sp.]|nr:recombinase family protein [Ruminococcus sp.]MCM1391230.1 recombinase family protein [Ruminococcus sp.]MCM1484796.1 recombinase family protein [Faecalibacterium sp.]